MNKTIGIIGGGNMGSAIINGIRKSNIVEDASISTSDRDQKALQTLKGDSLMIITSDNLEVASSADILFLAVKPQIYPTVLTEIKGKIRPNATIVSIAAGLTIDYINGYLGEDVKVVRAMTNTPALIGQAMSALSVSPTVSKEELDHVIEIFDSFGKTEVVDESLMDTVTGTSGSMPAYIFMMIESMADAAVLNGMNRHQAYTFIAQTVLGAALLVLETGQHPGALKDMVTSPGGTTIEGVYELEKKGFRQAIMSAVIVGTEKSKALGKK